MFTMKMSPPSVLCLSGFDPSGGAGIQADIESIASMGGHAVPVITSNTVQNTINVSRTEAVDSSFFSQQINNIFENITIKVIKIGMIGSPEITEVIHSILNQYADLPVIYDPVLASGAGTRFVDEENLKAIQKLIIPFTTILTPNSPEARVLSGEDDLVQCGKTLMQKGCESVLITGTHESNEHVDNLWFNEGQLIETFSWERLPYEYHGSGCTLASAIAALVAQGLDGFNAVNEAQDYSWNALKQAYRISQEGQYIPNRFYWAQEDE